MTQPKKNLSPKARAGNQNARKPKDAVRVPFAARLPGDIIAAIEDEQAAMLIKTGERPSQADALAAIVRRAIS